MTSQKSSDAVPALLRGRYRLGKLIGSGGLAGVYRARDEFLGRDVAIKIFRATASAEADFRRQEEEVNVLARLSHPNLVTLLDAAVDRTDAKNPRVYFVMELVEGTDLEQHLRDGSLTPRQIAQLGFNAASGLEVVHDRGVVHRDIKPSNILLATYLNDDNRVTAKITDFGIASVGSVDPLRPNELVTGTVAYLSPEQASGEIVTTASDVYSLGLVLLKCFTGEVAFSGPPQTAALARLIDDPAIPDSVPADWEPLLSAMTSRVAADRPNMHEVALALREKFTSESGRHRMRDDLPATSDEADRLEAIRRYVLMDAPTDGIFDRITALAARVLSAPVAIVSIVDEERIRFASKFGLEIDHIDRDAGLWAAAIVHDSTSVVEDARLDSRTLTNPLVAGKPQLQFYAGVPLRTYDGHNLGTLCVLDYEPRTIEASQIATLEDLAAMVMHELELRLENRRLARSVDAAAGPLATPADTPSVPADTPSVPADGPTARTRRPRASLFATRKYAQPRRRQTTAPNGSVAGTLRVVPAGMPPSGDPIGESSSAVGDPDIGDPAGDLSERPIRSEDKQGNDGDASKKTD